MAQQPPERANRMAIDYKHWFNLDYWTFEEAACLFHGIDPNDTNELHRASTALYTTPSANDYASRSYDPYKIYKNTLKIFKQNDWDSLDSSAITKGMTRKENYFKLAQGKKIKLPQDLNDACAKHISKTTKNNNHKKLSIFQSMKNLSYNEVTLTFIAGEMIEITARNTKANIGYESLSLKNMTTGKLNKSGEMLLNLAQNKNVKASANTQHKRSLKKAINLALNVDGEPFPTKADSPEYYGTQLNIEDKRDRADERAKIKSEKSLFGKNEQHQDSKSRELDKLANKLLDQHKDEK